MQSATGLLALLALLAFALSAWGWGSLVLQACRAQPASLVAYPVALGLAALAAVGGWLNLGGIAYPPILWALLIAGWASAAQSFRRFGFTRPANRSSMVPAGFIAIWGVLLALTV